MLNHACQGVLTSTSFFFKLEQLFDCFGHRRDPVTLVQQVADLLRKQAGTFSVRNEAAIDFSDPQSYGSLLVRFAEDKHWFPVVQSLHDVVRLCELHAELCVFVRQNLNQIGMRSCDVEFSFAFKALTQPRLNNYAQICLSESLQGER